ncbi:helix-turn-helix domain-containing protein [Desulfobotulus sp.]|jgi:chromosome segregation ATPase|uniref:helix-turn-helix domain-containing protein n=1 Tax=Desulfobotulus sp. TaxID=1940337 RepID=UPI002A36D476|nr:helix-turn-helix domain-containing protein [Desulfobotulus sp.]MDY0164885.1 helix-turn-helix domain-containing protein [Desulfobotulus sp.]
MMNVRDQVCGTIGKRMEQLRLSAQELGDATGDTDKTAYRWCKTVLPRTQKIPAICKILQITPNELFGFEDAYENPKTEIKEVSAKGGKMEDAIRQMYEDRIEELRKRIEKQDSYIEKQDSYITDLQKTVERETRRSEKLEEKLDKSEIHTEKLQTTLEKLQEKITLLLQENTLLKTNAFQAESDSRKKASGE